MPEIESAWSDDGLSAVMLAFVFIVVLLMVISLFLFWPSETMGDAMATWTPRPTGLPTREVFLPLVECEGPATATPIPRPTIGVSNDED